MPLLRWILILAILPVTSSQGQPVTSLRDSLNVAYKQSDDKTIDRLLLAIVREHLKEGSVDSAERYSRILLSRSEKKSNELSEAWALNAIATVHSTKNNLDSAIFYYIRAIDIFKVLKDTADAPIALSNLGRIYRKRSQYERAIAVSIDALAYLEPNYHQIERGSQALATCYTIIGSCYTSLKDFEGALDYHQKALLIRQEENNYKGIAISYNNIGNAYEQLGQYDSAIANLQRALAIRERIKEEFGSTLHNLGEVMTAQKKDDEAMHYYLLALERKRLENDMEGLPVTLNSLAKLHMVRGAYGNASKYLSEGNGIARSMGLMQELKDNLELEVSLYDLQNDPRHALLAAKELLVVKDSLLNKQKAQSLAEMRIRYESEKSAQEIKLLQEKTLNSQNRIEMLIIVVVLIFITALLLTYSIVVTRRSKKKVELLLKELHHRVKNNLQVLSSLLSLQSQQLTDSNAIQAVKSSEGRVNAMALIHRKLYLGDTNRTIDIKDYITELVSYLVHTYGYHEREFTLDLQIEPISVDVDKAIPLGLILNELISNAFKYAYAEHANPELYIGISATAPGALMIQVRDNGKGMPEPKKDEPVSFGLKMVNTLIRELRGNLAVTANKGTTYILNIPL